jgi:hypothetical protein
MRYEYGVQCKMETFWPKWDNWLARYRVGRWLLAQWLAWDMEPNSGIYDCGPHRVVRRAAPARCGGTETP